MVSNNDSSDLFERLCAGDSEAATTLWNGYYQRLVRLARQKLGDFPCRAFDEEDVALSAIHCFLKEAEIGRIYRWKDNREIWRLLRTITKRKAFAHKRRELREKRGGGKVRGESAFGRTDSSRSTAVNIQRVADTGPTPSQLNVRAEEAEQLLDILGDESLRRVARLRLAGHTNEEIANTLGCARRTVERKMERIRRKWQQRASAPHEHFEDKPRDPHLSWQA
jgi:DNA-directed RNA polymerase specialized sigma24 family protein